MSGFDEKQFDEAMAEFKKRLPQSVVQPEELSARDRIRFRCYPGIGCFTRCCSGVRIILTPYDIYRLRNRLGLSYHDFLIEYTKPDTIDSSSLPVVSLLMKDDREQSCPFVTPEGCTVYSDRPLICRYYPVGMGIMKKFDKRTGEDFFLLVKEPHCLGHQEEKTWTIDEWRADQESDLYDEMNADWMEVVLKAKTLGMVTFSDRSLELFYIISTNLDLFRDFFFGSGLAATYDLSAEEIRALQEDDLAFLRFSQKWLRFILFGEGGLKVKPSVREKVQKKLEKEKEQVLKAAQAKARPKANKTKKPPKK